MQHLMAYSHTLEYTVHLHIYMQSMYVAYNKNDGTGATMQVHISICLDYTNVLLKPIS